MSRRIVIDYPYELYKSSTYNSWYMMKQRCNNPKYPDYPNYGGRGITYTPAWETFGGFLTGMGVRPGPEYTLHRMNNNGNYEKANCKWATRIEQNSSGNRRPKRRKHEAKIDLL